VSINGKYSEGAYVDGGAAFSANDGDYYTTRVAGDTDELIISINDNPGGINPFETVHKKVRGSVVNGYQGVLHWRNWPTEMYGFSHEPLPMESAQDSRTAFLAATNPARADILLPVSLAELRDIPNMVKEMGEVAIHLRDHGLKSFSGVSTAVAAKANLAYQFGWRPFVQDIWTCVNFQANVDKRRKELEALSSGPGLRRTMSKRWDQSRQDFFPRAGLLSWGGTNIYADITVLRTAKRWVVGHWRPTYDGSIPSSDGAIRRLLTGFDPGNIPANVWAALPWSWLTDYFYNIGNIIDAGNRTVATPYMVSVQTEQRQYATHPEWADRGLSGGHVEHVRRYRNVDIDYAPISASFPTLGAGQLSILGSLAVSKNRRFLGH